MTKSKVTLTLFLLFATACTGMPPTPNVTAVVCDISTSSECDNSVIREALQDFMFSSPPSGSTMEVWIIGCDIADVRKVFEIEVPHSWGTGVTARRRAWQVSQKERIASFRLPDRVSCSGIAAGIFKAASVLHEREGVNRHLWLVSDLREVSELADFERKIPTPRKFVTALRNASLLPDLKGIHVDVCRVHDHATPDVPRWTAKKSRALKEAWSAAFAAMNISEVTLKEKCVWEGTGKTTTPIAVIP
ncbi:MAG: hypothetical protein HY897_25930 [Deltaproteobacteria bacterium]|nr:hypothetical protein [Deltaproteobacteria bacterium]